MIDWDHKDSIADLREKISFLRRALREAHRREDELKARLNLNTRCVMCKETALNTQENGGPEVQLSNGSWCCSRECHERYMINAQTL